MNGSVWDIGILPSRSEEELPLQLSDADTDAIGEAFDLSRCDAIQVHRVRGYRNGTQFLLQPMDLGLPWVC